MGYEYHAIANDPDDYRRRREALLSELESWATFSRRAGPREIWLSDPARPQCGWEEAQLLFVDSGVHLTCMAPLSAAVRADLRALLARIGGAAGARYLDDDGEPASL